MSLKIWIYFLTYRREWSTLSNALLKSSKIKNEDLILSSPSLIYSVMFSIAVVVLCALRKPDCPRFKLTLLSRNATIWFHKIISYDNAGSTLIGLYSSKLIGFVTLRIGVIRVNFHECGKQEVCKMEVYMWRSCGTQNVIISLIPSIPIASDFML